jgi:hypothetical protein
LLIKKRTPHFTEFFEVLGPCWSLKEIIRDNNIDIDFYILVIWPVYTIAPFIAFWVPVKVFECFGDAVQQDYLFDWDAEMEGENYQDALKLEMAHGGWADSNFNTSMVASTKVGVATRISN